MTEAKVRSLGYLGLEVRDLPAWRTFMATVFGLAPTRDTGAMLAYRIDERSQRIQLFEGPRDRVAHVGWDCGSSGELDEVAARLRDNQIKVVEGGADRCAQRGVRRMVVADAPDGIVAELYSDLLSCPEPAFSSTNRSGFRTGALGLGHAVFVAQDEEVTARWYQDMFGFRLSDRVYWSGGRAVFLRCNPRHHSAAFHNEIFGMAAGQLNHFMVEANDMDDVGRAYDIVLASRLKLGLTIGKHSNDLMTSFYVTTPSGWWIEYGWGGLSIDDATWETKFFDSPKVWGHIGSESALP